MTSKQERFCAEYLVDSNAADAARRAGYSTRTARSIGAENLTKPDIAGRIAELQAARSERVELTTDDVLRAIWAEAQRVDDRATHSARVAALRLAAQHLGMLIERVETKDVTDLSAERIAGLRADLLRRSGDFHGVPPSA